MVDVDVMGVPFWLVRRAEVAWLRVARAVMLGVTTYYYASI